MAFSENKLLINDNDNNSNNKNNNSNDNNNNKCAVLIMKRSKLCTCEGTVLPDTQVIRGFEKDDGYKYLEILEADDMKHCDMKEVIFKR